MARLSIDDNVGFVPEELKHHVGNLLGTKRKTPVISAVLKALIQRCLMSIT
jgi:hypothetical protein